MTYDCVYDAQRRRGSCSCGGWITFGVSEREFAVKRDRHLVWHQEMDLRVAAKAWNVVPQRLPRITQSLITEATSAARSRKIISGTVQWSMGRAA